MYKRKTIIAVIPARGSSKGVPHKNIRLLSGKPLIAWTIEEAKKSKYLDRLILSSDSKKIIAIAIEYGCEVPFVRPSEIAGDNALSVDTLIHAVKTIQEKYDYAVLLQCTSPLRMVKDIDAAIAFCIDKGFRSCIGVSESRHSPYFMRTIDKKGRLSSILKSGKTFLPRQLLPKIYNINGAFYMINTKTLLKTKSLLIKDTLAYVMDDESSLDIDTITDFKIAEVILKERIRQKIKLEKRL